MNSFYILVWFSVLIGYREEAKNHFFNRSDDGQGRFSPWSDACAADKASAYWVGAGIADITGPISDVNFMGYANPGQVAGGVHIRLYSRAIVFGDDDEKSRFAFVSVDTGMASYAVTREVVNRLNRTLPGKYSEANICISGTHTHSGPAGFFQTVLYQITSLGFVRQTFDTFVEGIVESIVNAHNRAKPNGQIRMSRTKMKKDFASINRSPLAYLRNPKQERDKYPDGDTDLDMTLLKMIGNDGNDIAMLNWFAVHGTTMPNTNKLVSGDNKGFASQLFEIWKNGPLAETGKGNFVAAFAQSNLGDVSPNINGTFCSDTGLPCDAVSSTCGGRNELCHGRGPSSDPFESVSIIGTRQAELAKKLYDQDENSVIVEGNEVDFRHVFRDMSDIDVHLPNGTTVHTCKASMGYSFAAGTTDGPGDFDFTQTTTTTNPFWEALRNIIVKPSKEIERCQAPKAVLLPTGEVSFPYDWAPKVVPVQLLRLGKSLAIVVVPSEFTTMAGRRIRKAVENILRDGGLLDPVLGKVVLAGLANEYSSYVTTIEEYQMQRYEGGSTLFGPYTLDAYIQIAESLAHSMVDRTHPDPGTPPQNFMGEQISLLPSPLPDVLPVGKQFGDVIEDVKPMYDMNSSDLVISATFHASNPRQRIRRGGSYLSLMKKNDDGTWQLLRNDADYDTRFIWNRHAVIYSRATIEWRPNASLRKVESGIYRLEYHGDKKGLFGDLTPFVGYSSEFYMRSNVDDSQTTILVEKNEIKPSGFLSFFGYIRKILLSPFQIIGDWSIWNM